MIKSYEQLEVWQRSVKLCLEIYKTTKSFPKDELYCLVSQMRRCSVSIPSNIAEGRSRGTKKDFCQYLRVSLGSLAELRTQLYISKELSYLAVPDYDKIFNETNEIGKMLNAMINKLAANS